MEAVLQTRLPEGLWDDPRLGRLPGIQPVPDGGWLIIDEAFEGQMRLRDRLLERRVGEVTAQVPGSEAAVAETLDRVLAELAGKPGYEVDGSRVLRPDGVTVGTDPDRPLVTLGRLCQEDFCILQKKGDEHVLTAAVLCFPASWSLSEKIGRPLTGIHQPVAPYDAGVARRVQRLFDAIRPDRPLWRVNLLGYDDPALHQPRPMAERRNRPKGDPPFVRSERQCLVRLEKSDAVVFSIHSFVLRRADLSATEHAALETYDAAVKAGLGVAAAGPPN